MTEHNQTTIAVDRRVAIASDAALREAALRAANSGRRGARGGRLSWIWEWAKIFPAAVLLFLLLRAFLVEAYKIPSGSMERTLLVGDFLIVNKLVYGAEIPFSGAHLPAIRAPRHGDVIVFEWPVDPSKNFVKRLVGLPGDTVSMQAGVLVRNGMALKEAYVEHTRPDVDPLNEEFRLAKELPCRSITLQPVVEQLGADRGAAPTHVCSWRQPGQLSRFALLGFCTGQSLARDASLRVLQFHAGFQFACAMAYTYTMVSNGQRGEIAHLFVMFV